MDCRQALIDLIAYCQRQEVLSSDSKVIKELSDILEWEEIDVEELFD